MSLAENDHLLPKPIEIPGPTSPQSSLLAGRQRYLLFPSFPLESGVTLTNVPVAFKTWGKLAPTSDNALVVCHALTGSADVEDWWGPLLGRGRVFDYSRFFIVCCNVLGSPYGSASSCTQAGGESQWAEAVGKGEEGIEKLKKKKFGWKGEGWWGPEFPPTTVRDDVRIQKLVLEHLGVQSIAAVVGGSMGGMAVLEWPLVFPTRFPGQTTSRYISAIVPLATSARHSAWCISWAEAQRQSIYSDPLFKHGYYPSNEPPRNGLSAARMAALLTYRSRDSFESRFGRRVGKALKGGLPGRREEERAKREDEQRRRSVAEDAAAAHNEGNLSPRVHPYGSNSPSSNGYFTAANNGPSLSPTATTPPVPSTPHPPTELSDEAALPPPVTRLVEPFSPSSAPEIFSAQSYLRYQGDKFVNRFDANCYIHLTRKMDSHDVARGRHGWRLTFSPSGSLISVSQSPGAKPQTEEAEDMALVNVLSFLSRHEGSELKPQPPAVLVVSIESDGLFAPPEQRLIHQLVEGSEFISVKSSDGHDGFLLEFEQINSAVGGWLKRVIGEMYEREEMVVEEEKGEEVKESVFGEVEDVTRW